MLAPVLCIGLSLRAAPQALQGHVGTAIAQHHQNWRDALTLQLRGLFVCHFEGQRQRRTATTGQACHGAFGPHQRARHGQQQLCLCAPERHDADAVAPGIGLLQQQLDGALGFGQALQSGRARSVQRQDQAT